MHFRYATNEDCQRRSLQEGYVIATYDELLRSFGLPNELFSDTHKVACEWTLAFADGTCASIYAYSEFAGATPDNPQGRYQWHIGGKSNYAVDRIVEALGTSQFQYLQPDDYEEDNFDEIPF